MKENNNNLKETIAQELKIKEELKAEYHAQNEKTKSQLRESNNLNIQLKK